MKIILPTPKSSLYVGLLLMLIKVIFSASAILPYSDFLDDILSYCAAGILAIYIILKKYSSKTLFVYALITGIALYSTMITKQYGFLITVIACLALRDENITKAINFIYKWELLLIIIHSAYAVFLSGISNYALYGGYYGRIRFHFGFSHPNVFSIYLFNLIIMWIYLNYDKIKMKNIIIIFLISFILQLLTDTRTSFIDIIIVLLIVVIVKKWPNNKIIKQLAMWITPTLSILVLIACKFYLTGNQLLLLLDSIFSARIRLGAYAYTNYGLTLLGQNMENINIEWDSNWRLSGFTFDCTFSYLMMNQGVIWLIIIIIGFYLLAKKGDDKIAIMVVAWGLYALTEVHGINGFRCFPILLLSILLRPENRTKTTTINTVGNKNDKYYSANL